MSINVGLTHSAQQLFVASPLERYQPIRPFAQLEYIDGAVPASLVARHESVFTGAINDANEGEYVQTKSHLVNTKSQCRECILIKLSR